MLVYTSTADTSVKTEVILEAMQASAVLVSVAKRHLCAQSVGGQRLKPCTTKLSSLEVSNDVFGIEQNSWGKPWCSVELIPTSSLGMQFWAGWLADVIAVCALSRAKPEMWLTKFIVHECHHWLHSRQKWAWQTPGLPWPSRQQSTASLCSEGSEGART